MWDLAGQTLDRLTFDPGLDARPSWTPDGQRIVFSSERNGDPFNVYWKAADGTGLAERLAESDRSQIATDVTPDGTRVLATARDTVSSQGDIITVTLDGDDPAVETLLMTEFDEQAPAVSPDGKWVAYRSNESGRFEVYVRPFPDMESGRWQVSTGGGGDPVWSQSGGELFYQAGTSLMAVSIQAEPGFATRGTPEVLFDRSAFFTPNRITANYDVAPDGRFLMIRAEGQASDSRRINVVLNWFQELTERVPVD